MAPRSLAPRGVAACSTSARSVSMEDTCSSSNVELVVGLQVDAAAGRSRSALEALQAAVRFPEARAVASRWRHGKRQALLGRRVERFADAPRFVLAAGPRAFSSLASMRARDLAAAAERRSGLRAGPGLRP